MGWFLKAIKGVVVPRAAGESVIEGTVANYLAFQRTKPHFEPHQILILVFLARMRTHGKDTKSDEMYAEAFRATVSYACLPFPHNAAALAVDFIRLELPHVIRKCPDFESFQSGYLVSVQNAQERGVFNELYQKYNPTKAARSHLS